MHVHNRYDSCDHNSPCECKDILMLKAYAPCFISAGPDMYTFLTFFCRVVSIILNPQNSRIKNDFYVSFL